MTDCCGGINLPVDQQAPLFQVNVECTMMMHQQQQHQQQMTAINDKRMLDREALRSVIQQWNANRLDLFELSEPDEVMIVCLNPKKVG